MHCVQTYCNRQILVLTYSFPFYLPLCRLHPSYPIFPTPKLLNQVHTVPITTAWRSIYCSYHHLRLLARIILPLPSLYQRSSCLFCRLLHLVWCFLSLQTPTCPLWEPLRLPKLLPRTTMYLPRPFEAFFALQSPCHFSSSQHFPFLSTCIHFISLVAPRHSWTPPYSAPAFPVRASPSSGLVSILPPVWFFISPFLHIGSFSLFVVSQHRRHGFLWSTLRFLSLPRLSRSLHYLSWVL